MVDYETFELDILMRTHLLFLKREHPDTYRVITASQDETYRKTFSKRIDSIKQDYAKGKLTPDLVQEYHDTANWFVLQRPTDI